MILESQPKIKQSIVRGAHQPGDGETEDARTHATQRNVGENKSLLTEGATEGTNLNPNKPDTSSRREGRHDSLKWVVVVWN